MKQLLFLALVVTTVASCGTKPGEAQADGTAAPINVNSLSQPGSSSTPANPLQTTGTTPVTATVPAATTTTAPTGAVNPAHGAPGHRCELPVGAPLTGAPAPAASTAPTSSVAPAPTITTSAPVITPTQPAVKTGPGLNPAHGQPGHRCDIAVGEPLNSKPAATTPTVTSTPAVTPSVSTTPSISPILNPTGTTTTTISPVTSQPAATKTKTAPGMNPPHGEPGHKCEIAVGAPLNSKPGPVITNANKDSFQIKNK